MKLKPGPAPVRERRTAVPVLSFAEHSSLAHAPAAEGRGAWEPSEDYPASLLAPGLVVTGGAAVGAGWLAGWDRLEVRCSRRVSLNTWFYTGAL
ncbi:hypothetical protein FA95DRAFT_1558977, partial [Auriscalpium vulgare]